MKIEYNPDSAQKTMQATKTLPSTRQKARQRFRSEITLPEKGNLPPVHKPAQATPEQESQAPFNKSFLPLEQLRAVDPVK